MKTLDIEELRQEYNQREPSFKKLGEALKKAIEKLLEIEGIKVQFVSVRIKEFDSFYEKIPRKGYADPFDQTQDFCGVRIVAFLRSDVQKINSIIQKEFSVHEHTDKEDELDMDRFGYRSHQYIVSIKPEWLHSPEYRDLENLRAEIQVRSILMHAWAELSHKMAYKKKEDVPREFLRQIYQLSAILENLDEQFDALQERKANYQRKILSESAETGVRPRLNADILQAVKETPKLQEGRYAALLRDDYITKLEEICGKSERDNCIEIAIKDYLKLPERIRDKENEKQRISITWFGDDRPEYLMFMDFVHIRDEVFEQLVSCNANGDIDRSINAAIRLWLQSKGVEDLNS